MPKVDPKCLPAMGKVQTRRLRNHWWKRRTLRRRRNRALNRRAAAANPLCTSHPRGRRAWRKLPAQAKRRIRRLNDRSAIASERIARLRKQLSQDVLVDCWSDRIREAPDGSLEVSFGGTTSKPNTISFTSLNINGCNHLTDRGEEKLQFLVRDIIKEERDVVLLQHTSAQKDDQPETDALAQEGMRMFVHGAEQENNHIHGGVGIILSRKAIKAWKEAGSPDPITSGIFSGTARYMSLDLNWKDSRERTLQYRVISLYMPTSKYPAEEYTAVLESLEKDVLSGCRRDGRIPIIGADINGSMGIHKKEEAESEGSDKLKDISPIGPYGIDKTNRNGQLFLSFLADNKLCSALMSRRTHK